MRMGTVHLTVADLARSLAYYEQRDRSARPRPSKTALRASAPAARTCSCSRSSRARLPADGFSGLFHFALLVPSARRPRRAGSQHAARERVQLTGLSDHVVSEALYLRDPDHHGIEIYADRPRETWEGKVGERMTTMPLDTDDLLAGSTTRRSTVLPDGTTMGHVHFCVADIPATVDFYRGARLRS